MQGAYWQVAAYCIFSPSYLLTSYAIQSGSQVHPYCIFSASKQFASYAVYPESYANSVHLLVINWQVIANHIARELGEFITLYMQGAYWQNAACCVFSASNQLVSYPRYSRPYSQSARFVCYVLFVQGAYWQVAAYCVFYALFVQGAYWQNATYCVFSARTSYAIQPVSQVNSLHFIHARVLLTNCGVL